MLSSPLELLQPKKRTKSEAYFQVGHACTCTVFNFTDAVFFVSILLGNNAARAQAKTAARIGSAFVRRFHGQVTSLGSRLCFLQGRAFKIQPLCLHPLLCSFWPALFSDAGGAFTNLSRIESRRRATANWWFQQRTGVKPKKLSLLYVYARPKDFSKRREKIPLIFTGTHHSSH